MTTATPVLADLLDAIVNRLGDIATDLRSNLSRPALAEVRAAARAAERAYVLLSPWVPHQHADELDRIAILEAIDQYSVGGFWVFTDDEHDTAVIEATALEGADNYVRVTMPGCVYLLKGEDDSAECTGSGWRVEGRYPQ